MQILIGFFFFITVSDPQNIPMERLVPVTLMKFLNFNSPFHSEPKGISVYVLKASAIARHFKRFEGRSFNQLKLEKVSGGNTLPKTIPDVLIIGEVYELDEVLAYTRTNKVMSVTTSSALFEKGVSIGILKERSRIKIVLNPRESLLEGAHWNFDFTQLGKISLEFRGE